MEVHINKDYIILNQKLLYEMVTGKIGISVTVYYTMENALINDYFADINDIPGLPAGMMTAMELSELLLISQFK